MIKRSRLLGGTAALTLPIAVWAAVPKCPMCVAAYLSAFGSVGALALPVTLAWPVGIALALGAVLFLRRAHRASTARCGAVGSSGSLQP